MKKTFKRHHLLIILFWIHTVCCSLNTRAQVRIDNYGDTLKGNVKRMTQNGVIVIGSPAGSQTSTTKCIYTYDTANGNELIKFYNELDK